MDPGSYDDMLPGCHDIADRIKDMDIEGVWAQLCFPKIVEVNARKLYHFE